VSSLPVFQSEPKFGVRCTAVGRVVYDKPRKAFGWRDLRRIASKVQTPEPEDARDVFVIFVTISTTMGVLLSRMAIEATAGARLVVSQSMPMLLSVLAHLAEELASFGPTLVKNLLTGLVDRLFPSTGA